MMEKMSLPSENADQLFRKHSVQEMRQYERLIAVHLDTHKQDVRTTIGERYPDLLQAANAIEEMYKAGVSAKNSLLEAEENCRLVAVDKQKVTKTPQQIKENETKQGVYQVAAQLKLIVDTPELVWHCIEVRNFLEAVRIYFRAKEMYKHLMQSTTCATLQDDKPVKVALLFPILPRQWESISHLKAQIAEKAHHEISQLSLSVPNACSCLLVLAYLERIPSSKLLQAFLDTRSAATKNLLKREDGNWQSLLRAFNLCLETCALFNQLTAQNTFEVLAQEHTSALALSKQQLNSKTLLVYKYLPSNIQAFQLAALANIEDVKHSPPGRIDTWLQEHEEWFSEQLVPLFNSLNLDGTRLYAVYDTFSHWESASPTARTPIMERVFIPCLRQSIEHSIKKKCRDQRAVFIEQLRKLEPNERKIGQYVWSVLDDVDFEIDCNSQRQYKKSGSTSSSQSSLFLQKPSDAASVMRRLGSLESDLIPEVAGFVSSFEAAFSELQSSYARFYHVPPERLDVASLIAQNSRAAIEEFQSMFEAFIDESGLAKPVLSQIAFVLGRFSRTPYLICANPAAHMLGSVSDGGGDCSDGAATLTHLLYRRRSFPKESFTSGEISTWWINVSEKWLDMSVLALSDWLESQSRTFEAHMAKYLETNSFDIDGIDSTWEDCGDGLHLPARFSFGMSEILRVLSNNLDDCVGPFLSSKLLSRLRQNVASVLEKLPLSDKLSNKQLQFDLVALSELLQLSDQLPANLEFSFEPRLVEQAKSHLKKSGLSFANLIVGIEADWAVLSSATLTGGSSAVLMSAPSLSASQIKAASFLPMAQKSSRFSMLPIAMPNVSF